MAKTEPSFKDLKEQLDSVVDKLQSDDLDVEEAISLYSKGQDLIKELESYLDKAENTVKELKAKFSS